MSQDALFWVIAVAVVVCSLSMVIQTVLWYGMSRALRGLQGEVNRLAPRAQSLIENAEKSIEQSRHQLTEVSTKANALLDSTRSQLERVDGLLTEATDRARVQMQRVEMVLDDTVGRVHKTVTVLNDGVLKPLREISGVSAGIRAAVTHFLAGRRPNVAQATSDEEMFI